MRSISKWFAAGAGAAAAAYASYVAQAYRRYGHPRPPRPDARDELLDALMPVYDVADRHSIEITAPPDVVIAAAREQRFDSSRIIRGIFQARQRILRGQNPPAPPQPMLESMKAIGWVVLAERPGRELVLGAATKPWVANPVFRSIPPAEFAAFAEPDYVKIVWTLRADPAPGGSTFFTETRAVATDDAARTKFRRYWSLLSPGIVAIRLALLPGLKAAAERAWQLAGDDVLPDARAQFTHAITIAAPPKDVWPWLVQMGCRRGGWYSWDVLDNGGKRSADHIVPELQHIAVGDVLPWRPDSPDGFKVVRVEPERSLVLEGDTPDFVGTWAFVLEPVGTDQTRLVARYRAAYPPSAKMALRVPFMEQVHGFMERKQLRTIKHHAEQMHAS